MRNGEISSSAQMTKMRSKVCHSSFGFRRYFVIRHSTFVICVALSALSVFAEPPPSAKDILDSVRMIESRQQIDLQGQLRQDDVVIPFRLVQNGPLIKPFEVVSAQKIEGGWFLKQMRVEQLQPGTNHVEARAYLEIKR